MYDCPTVPGIGRHPRTGMGNIFSAAENPLDADSSPAMDSWGPDFRGYWSLNDWLTWHQANVTKYGSSVANAKFITNWAEQSWGATPFEDLKTRPDAREYLRNAGVLQVLQASPSGALTDATQALANVLSGITSATTNLGWMIPVGVVILFLGYLAPSGRAIKDVVRR